MSSLQDNGGGLPPGRPTRRDNSQRSAPQVPQRRDPAIAKALQLSTFEDGSYSTEEFIGILSEKLIAESRADSGPFNPAPFIQTFSPALDSLMALRAQVAERTKSMETEVRRANREYGKRLRELDSGFEAVGGSFSTLEHKITDVGRTAARIGEQLESLHHTRSTAQATSLIVSYYLSLVQYTSVSHEEGDGSKSPLDVLYETRNSREGRARLAVVLRRLVTVAKDMADSTATTLAEANSAESAATQSGDDLAVLNARRVTSRRRTEKEKTDRVRDEVEKYCERFEKDVLKLFQRSYLEGDPRAMSHLAKVLQDFNGGTSCVQVYVNQHQFFISTGTVLKEASKEAGTQVDIWTSIGNPDAPPPTTEPGLKALFKEIRVTVSQEAQIMRAVFPNPMAVMQVFLQRVFAQVIQQHIESLVSRASAISTLAVLRVLHMCHSMCQSLVDDLKQYDSTLAGSSSSSKLPDTNSGPLVDLLNQAVEEIFVPWIEGTRYVDSESKNLGELYAGLLSRFARYHETVLKAPKNSLLDRVVGQIPGSATVGASGMHAAGTAISKYANLFTSSATSAFSIPGVKDRKDKNKDKTPSAPARSPLRLSLTSSPVPGGSPALSRTNSSRPDPSTPVDAAPLPQDGRLTVEMAERMLRWHAEAVGRVVELSSSADMGKNAFAVLKVLSEAIGRSFIDTALESALARLEQQEAKVAPDLTNVQVLRPADLVCHLWQRYTSTALLPLAPPASAVRREMTTFNQHNVIRMEGKMNAVIQKTIDVIVSWLSFILTKQKKADYKPKNDELSFARTNTEPCELACEFLAQVLEAANEYLSGKNREAFLTEVGVIFHTMLLDHYKRYPVNPTGALMLTKDLAAYQESIAAFKVSALNDRFDMLRELGNSFNVVQPEVLRNYLMESHLGRIDMRLLKPYLQQRSDWSTVSRMPGMEDAWASTDDVATGTGSGTSTPSLMSGAPGLMSAGSLSRRAGNRLSATVANVSIARLLPDLHGESSFGRNGTRTPVGSSAGGGAGGVGAGAGNAPPPSAYWQGRSVSSGSNNDLAGTAGGANGSHGAGAAAAGSTDTASSASAATARTGVSESARLNGAAAEKRPQPAMPVFMPMH